MPNVRREASDDEECVSDDDDFYSDEEDTNVALGAKEVATEADVPDHAGDPPAGIASVVDALACEDAPAPVVEDEIKEAVSVPAPANLGTLDGVPDNSATGPAALGDAIEANGISDEHKEEQDEETSPDVPAAQPAREAPPRPTRAQKDATRSERQRRTNGKDRAAPNNDAERPGAGEEEVADGAEPLEGDADESGEPGKRGGKGAPAEPYDVPSFGSKFFLHDDRYTSRRPDKRRGDRGGRGGALWEEGGDLWKHDKFVEMADTHVAPRMMSDVPRTSERRGGRGGGRGRGPMAHDGSARLMSQLEHSAGGPPGVRHLQPGAHDGAKRRDFIPAERPRFAGGRHGGRRPAEKHAAPEEDAPPGFEDTAPAAGAWPPVADGAAANGWAAAQQAPAGASAAINGASGSRRYLQSKDATAGASAAPYASAPSSLRPPTMVRTDATAPHESRDFAPPHYRGAPLARSAGPSSAQAANGGGPAAQPYPESRLATSFNPNAPQFQPHHPHADSDAAVRQSYAQRGGDYGQPQQAALPAGHAHHSGYSLAQSVGGLSSALPLPGAPLVSQAMPTMAGALMQPASLAMFSQPLMQQNPQLSLQQHQSQLALQQQALMGQLQGMHLGPSDPYLAPQISQGFVVSSQPMWMQPMMTGDALSYLHGQMDPGVPLSALSNSVGSEFVAAQGLQPQMAYGLPADYPAGFSNMSGQMFMMQYNSALEQQQQQQYALMPQNASAQRHGSGQRKPSMSALA